mmetsp:Transcript_23067/g.53781  ORF Transcript_23067/g.53781 Transcript_23067/m.53781 type:complete len:181 (+) Transcript_23067:41-583(+)
MVVGWLRGVWHGLQPQLADAGAFGVKWMQFVGTLHILHEYLFDFSTTAGASMVPTIRTIGDVVLIDRLSLRFRPVRRGEVVISHSSKDSNSRLCKRVGGIAGDRCLMEDGTVVDVPRGHVFLVGDNQPVSHDSRHYGPVPQGLLLGIVRMKLWPLDEVGEVFRRKVRWTESGMVLGARIL